MARGSPGPIAVVAGSGRLAPLLLAALSARSISYRVVALRGFADRGLRRRADSVIDLLDIGGTLEALARWRPSGVVLVGGVRRPSPSAVFNAVSAWRNRHELSALLARGDDHLLRGVLALLEEHGHRVVSVGELAPELLASGGTLGSRAPSVEARQSIAIGFDLLDRLSPFDIGQAAVVVRERVLAVEGAEGTDRMLARVRGMRGGWRALFGRTMRGGVLIKAAKREQDRRVDLPAIGPRTLVRAAKAGLDGVAVEVSSTLILDHAETVATADRLGLFLVGIEPRRPEGEGL